MHCPIVDATRFGVSLKILLTMRNRIANFFSSVVAALG
jgi:hypothetical protein